MEELVIRRGGFTFIVTSEGKIAFSKDDEQSDTIMTDEELGWLSLVISRAMIRRGEKYLQN